MGLIAAAIQGRRKVAITPSTLGIPAGGASLAAIGIGGSASLSIPTVMACCRLISEQLGSLPFGVYERRGRKRIERFDHPVQALLDRPNPLMSGQRFRRVMGAWRLLWGAAYGAIIRDGSGRPVEIWPMHPASTTRVGSGRVFRYETYSEWFGSRSFSPSDMIAVLGVSMDGVSGLSVISAHARALGIAQSAERAAESFATSGLRTAGIIELPQNLTAKARGMLEDAIIQDNAGLPNIYRPLLLPKGAVYKPLTMNPADVEFLETRKFQAEEICRMFGVPPHKVGLLDRATFSNIEQQALEFVTDRLYPDATEFETSFAQGLLGASEVSSLFLRLNLSGILRADIKSRFLAYAIGRQWGWLSANDVRALEDQNPIEGGDVYLQAVNMQDANAIGDAIASDGKKAFNGNAEALRAILRELAYER